MIHIKEFITHKFTIVHDHIPAFGEDGTLILHNGEITVVVEIPIRDTIDIAIKDTNDKMMVVKERILRDSSWMKNYPNPIQLHIILDIYDLLKKQEDGKKSYISIIDSMVIEDLYTKGLAEYGRNKDEFLSKLSSRITDTVW